jgi:hypothetical protein
MSNGIDALWFWGGIGIALALAFHGWPSLITIHKHYHKGDGDDE